MTGREKIAAAFSAEGSAEIPVVTCYPTIFERDHFAELTSLPWWFEYETDAVKRAQVVESLTMATDIDWFCMPSGAALAEQQHICIAVKPEGVFRIDDRSGHSQQLFPPLVSGNLRVISEEQPVIDDLQQFLSEQIPHVRPFQELQAGEERLPALLMSSLGQKKMPIMHLSSPLWWSSEIMGYEQWFTYLATDAEVIYQACWRLLDAAREHIKYAKALGCQVIWIEECLTDQIGPQRYQQYNLPLLRALTGAIKDAGLHSVYYFCGDPWPTWDLIIQSGADALSFEESKKGFAIDIAEVVERVQGQFTVLGNLDSIGILEQGTAAELRGEVRRQLEAGRRNGNRFIMSTGSPITPHTPVSRVCEYVQLVREYGNSL